MGKPIASEKKSKAVSKGKLSSISMKVKKDVVKRGRRIIHGLAAAKAATKMTSEQWKKHQIGMANKWPAPEYMNVEVPGRKHTSYRDETFQLVTRFLAETKIAYRPHAKAPGTKSHVRYEKYAKAKTVGESLKLGSYPEDWCWDYERGFIKVLGPSRDEPLDISKVMDEKELTKVDLAIHRWYRRELARKLGLSYKDLGVDKGGMESTTMRAHRLVAQREAKKRLEAAIRERRAVTDEEVDQTLHEWAFARNFGRVNVLPKGQEWVWSDTLGLLRDRIGDIHLTTATMKYPDVTRLIVKWLKDRLPAECKDFAFTSLNLNCNYAARIHRDGNNFGPSMIAAFGNFTGGELNYWPNDSQTSKVGSLKPAGSVSLNLSKGLAMFNGNCAHDVNSFKGERYSVVYFSLGCHAKMPAKEHGSFLNLHLHSSTWRQTGARKDLESLGVPCPSVDASPYELLRAPPNVKASKAPSKEETSKKLPLYRYWPRDKLSFARSKAGTKRSSSSKS